MEGAQCHYRNVAGLIQDYLLEVKKKVYSFANFMFPFCLKVAEASVTFKKNVLGIIIIMIKTNIIKNSDVMIIAMRGPNLNFSVEL